jgi:hypothetical protein
MHPTEFATALDPLRVFQGLTAKQEQYALERFRGTGQAEAYRMAFGDENTTAETAKRHGFDLDRHPGIVARVHQLTASRMKQSSLLADLSPEFVTDGIMRTAMFGEKESNRLRAYELLGKVAGIDLFRETTRIEKVDRTTEDVDKELKQKLQAMMEGLTIEGEANPAPAKPAPVATRDRRRKPTPK